MFFIDRVEEGLCVIYDDDRFLENVRADNVAGAVKEGAVVVKKEGRWCVDEGESEKRNEKMKSKLRAYFKK